MSTTDEKQTRRMNAYFYAFDETGVDSVDDILERVAIAGKMYHHTDSWTDPNEYDENKSCVDRIQEAAAKAAGEQKSLHRQLSLVREALKAIVDCYGVGYRNPDKCLSDMSDFILEARSILASTREAAG